MLGRSLGLAIVAVTSIGAVDRQSPPVGPAYEGVWYVSDSTDNNSGDREVWAFQTNFDTPDIVSLRMRCTKNEPTFAIEWSNQTFPDQSAVTIGTSVDADSDPTERQYVFEYSTDPVDRGLQASPETSAKIVSAIGEAQYVTVTVYPTSGRKTVGMDANGTLRAWARVSRHCPIRKMARPPL